MKIPVKSMKSLWLINFVIILSAFACLIFSFAVSDFSVLSVANHSHIAKPMIYKISAAWGHHEGSMLLWLSALIFFSLIFVCFTNGDNRLIATTSAAQALILSLFTAYTIFASNPFVRIFPAPVNGLGLNPILQDIGLALHPPMLYLGYVGFSLAFSSTIALLIHSSNTISQINACKERGAMPIEIGEQRVDDAIFKNGNWYNFSIWVRMISPWVLLSWSFLTLGIGLGSWWAYRELGWGGFWFWDPVENASLMPWLSGTALLHSLRQRGMAKWAIFFAIITFSLSMIGTFLVRSGIITSVHSFATDPTRGIYILSILSVLIFIALLLFSLKSSRFNLRNDTISQIKECKERGAMPIEIGERRIDDAIFKNGNWYDAVFESDHQHNIRHILSSRISYILLNNIFLFTACIIVFIGTLYPFALELFSGKQISVGAPYYNKLFAPLTLITVIVAAIGSSAPSQKKKNHKISWLIALLITISLQIYFGYKIEFSTVITVFSLWLMILMLQALFKNNTNPMLIAHLGFALVIFGISLNANYKTQTTSVLKPSETMKIKWLSVTLQEITFHRGSNYVSRIGNILVKDDRDMPREIGEQGVEDAMFKNGKWYYLKPETRLYTAEKQQTTESAILHKPLYDLYIVFGDIQENGEIIVRTFFEAGVSFIWFGCFTMFFAGMVAFILQHRLLLTRKYL